MTLSRRHLLGAAALTPLAVAGLSSCTGGGDTVKFGYIPDFNGTSLLAIAKDQNLWSKHNLNASIQSFTNGPLQIQALDTGDLEFGYIGPGAMWLPATGKAKVVCINAVGNADRVIAQAGIGSIADLKGKKVGVPEGTSGDMVLRLALEGAGLSIDDVEKVAMDPATVVTAFSAKQIDAAGIWYPLIDTIKKQVPDLVELAKNADFESTMAFPNVFVAGGSVVADQRDKALRTLKVLREAMDFRADNMQKTVELVAAMNSLEAAAVTADAGNGDYVKASVMDTRTSDGTITKWLDNMTAFFAGIGKADNALKAADFYTGDLWLESGSGN